MIGSWLNPTLGRRIHWLGKQELFDWPVIGWAARIGGIHPVDRDAADLEAFRLAIRILDAGPGPARLPRGHAQSRRRAPGGPRRARDARAADRGPHRPDRDRRPTASGPGPAAPAPGRPSHGPLRRRRSTSADAAPAAGTDRRAAKASSTTMIMDRIAALLAARQRGVYGRRRPASSRDGARRVGDATPWDNRAMGTVAGRPDRQAHRLLLRRARGDRQGEGGDARPASRRTPSARSSTTRASSATSSDSASRPSTRSTTSTTARRSSSAPTASGPEVMERAEARGLEVIDGTCTWVIQEQRELDGSSRTATRSSCSARPSTPRSSACSASRPTRSWSTRRRTGTDPAPQADGADHPVHPAALEVREARGVHGLARPRAQDHQHRVPGHHPPPGGHARDRRARWT